MQITVEFAAQAKAAAGTETENIVVAPSSGVQDVAETVCQKFGEKLRAILMDAQGKLHRSILVSVNDYHIFHHENPNLKDGDRLIFLSPVSGG
jgi:molybdopterin converting factor small subunit